MHYKYCPQCGTKLTDKIAGDDGFVPFCRKCDKYWFDTFASCVIILVANEFNEIALLNQSYISTKHANFVSGYIVPGENAEETAIREVKEEIGITLEKLEPAGTYWFEKKDMLMHGFIGYARKADFVLSSEVDYAEWVDALKAPEKMFPNRPGNVMQPLYRKYLRKTGLKQSE